ncbi:hypothetical protein M407DRAFT_11788 [Tulasnella calospora MUT 4182]|uniref:Uncharacterized protein n=1 Tax=Tulasnella calospora MUT 4182 TaxID=1051891 RepID=A0A0C3KB21_9AGAM|nr:hypothetical protein M407DRAFT_11788 [Tulasnella calospora MUT 4182]
MTPTIKNGTLITYPVAISLPTADNTADRSDTIAANDSGMGSPRSNAYSEGLSLTQIAAVLEFMSNAAEPSAGAQRDLGTSVRMGQADDPPPVYDFNRRYWVFLISLLPQSRVPSSSETCPGVQSSARTSYAMHP